MLLDGQNPYDLIGPGLEYAWPFRMLYPLTSMLAALPFSWMPLTAAWASFAALTSGVLAWALTRERVANPQLLALVSFAGLSAVNNGQWSPLLTATMVMPGLEWALACKPNLGAALFLAAPSWRRVAVIGGFLLLSVAVAPWWPAAWLHALAGAGHMTPLVLRPWGFLVLLAALKWRRPDARLLLALACVPMTPVPYETLPLFLVVETWAEGGILVGLMWLAAWLGSGYVMNDAAWFDVNGRTFVWCVYLPCVAMILRRPNVRPGPVVAPHTRGTRAPSESVIDPGFLQRLSDHVASSTVDATTPTTASR